MKSTLAACVFALTVLSLGGCSSMRDKSAMAKPYDVDDPAYIAQVERTARDRGVTVQWVNPPQKRVVNQ